MKVSALDEPSKQRDKFILALRQGKIQYGHNTSRNTRT